VAIGGEIGEPLVALQAQQRRTAMGAGWRNGDWLIVSLT
jgi:hypothetical protein